MNTFDESGQVVSELDEINTDFIHNKYGYCYFEIEPGKKPIIIEAAPRDDSVSFHELAVFYLSMGLTVTNLSTFQKDGNDV